MPEAKLSGKTVLVTGAARRIGRGLALACARAGADVVIHYGHSVEQASQVREKIAALGVKAWTLQADLAEPESAAELIAQAAKNGPIYGLVNSAAIFEPLKLQDTSLAAWERHLAVNLTAPFLLSQAFARQVVEGAQGRIINLLDWRALRPGPDHFPYTVSKAALAAMTETLALALAPGITVNGLALGAVLPPAGQPADPEILKKIPAERWADLSEVEDALVFLLTGPSYITGEIIYLDGGRHLV